MKKYIYFAVATALALSSCSEEDVAQQNNAGQLRKMEITAGMPDGNSRTSFTNNGIKWQENDKLSVFIGGGAMAQFNIVDGQGQNEAKFQGNAEKGSAKNNVAYYPYGEDVSLSTNENGYIVSASFPTVQQWAEDGSFGPNSLPMIAVTETTAEQETFQFNTLGGWLQLYVKGSASITKVVMKTTGKKIAGDYTVTAEYGKTPSIKMKESAIDQIAVVSAEGVQLSTEKATLFTLTVPPFSFNADEVIFDIYDNDGGIMENAYTINKSGTIIANAYYTLSKSNAVDYEANAYVTGYIANGVRINEEGEYEISNANGLRWFASEVNKYSNYEYPFKDETIKLMRDIDLNGEEWTPIGDYRFTANRFCGTFDGQNHTISNFKITKNTEKKDDKKSSYGFFGNVEGTIKNLTIDNATVDGVYAYSGVLVGRFNAGLIENCHVKNSSVSNTYWQGGILIGQQNGATEVKSCSVEKSSVTSKSGIAAIVGCYSGDEKNAVVAKFTDCIVKDCQIIQSGSFGGNYDNYFGAFVADIDAYAGSVYFDNCKVENTTVKGLESINLFATVSSGTVYLDGKKIYTEIPSELELTDNTIELVNLSAEYGMTISGTGTIRLDAISINAAECAAITLANDANVTLIIANKVSLTGADQGINVPSSATLTIDGDGELTVIGLNGSGIGNDGSITIKNLTIKEAKGNGDHAFGIGGNNANVAIKDATINYACGGHIQPLFIYDTKYGKSEPEGGAGIGGATIKIEGSTINKVDGGSKAAAIGAQYHQSTKIKIIDSTIGEANGGNASAGIGGSRYESGISESNKQEVYILIENSNIKANGGQYAAGIGSGYDTHCAANDKNATNDIIIKSSTIVAQGGQYAAGIGTGYHAAALTGSIDTSQNITATSGDKFYKDSYTEAQNIGYGVVDPEREFKDAVVTFTVAEKVIEKPTVTLPVAKVGDKEYKTIDEAIANWGNGATLTLLSNVTLSDVVTLKSTEHHILDLGTYTMTAASGKNAFVIKACGTGDSERTAITIKADEKNPGGIDAGKKCIIYYKYADGGISGNDRPIIKIEGGVFTGSTDIVAELFGTYLGLSGIYTFGEGSRQCATIEISGGTFNCSIYGLKKSKLVISGGVFNYSVSSQGDSTAHRLISGGKFKTIGFMTADDNNTKFWFGTKMGVSDVGLYIDDDNYLVVGGPVITEFGDKFKAKASNYSKWSSYLKYSSAATNGLYYTNADMAIKKHGEKYVELPTK